MFRSSPLLWFVAAVLLATACTQKMAQQPSLRPFQPSTEFADGTSARPVPADTVARGQLRDEPGLPGGPVDPAIVERGQQRFEVFCVPCHGYVGDGDGMVVQRGFSRPPSFHTDRLRQAPVDYLFGIISNGFGAMPSYATQIDVADRWAIVAYIRALQVSQNATVDDVPPDHRSDLSP